MSDDTYLMLVDGVVQEVDLGPVMRRHRAAVVKARAAAMSEVVELLGVESLDIKEVCDASGLPEPGVDAATYVALVLRLAEMGALLAE